MVINGYGLYRCVCGFSTTSAFEMQNHRCKLITKETHLVEEKAGLKREVQRLLYENERLKAQISTNKQVERIDRSMVYLAEIDLTIDDDRAVYIGKILQEYRDLLQGKKL